ncbi:hypothetical protein PF011_g30476 [Phytophthora fragariae]|uniref:Retrotransposon gag domain-containing protein n=1 Tax=Phytophthora fragariae TaxID=53985 RepID=A0A6A3GS63_9STRA|nr:hypothetical protein PF011_g30476 [Phytophthora fragariae]
MGRLEQRIEGLEASHTAVQAESESTPGVAGPATTTVTPTTTAARPATRPATRLTAATAPTMATARGARPRAPRRATPPDDGHDSGSDSYSDSSSTYSSDDHEQRGRRRRRRRPLRSNTAVGHGHRQGRRRKNAKDLELMPFKPSPTGVRVETWIAKVDLAVEGPHISGRGEWTDEVLYYIVGNNLQDDAAKFWVQMNKELTGTERTWSRLKAAMVRRYGERPDLATAEWRVMRRKMYPGETFADFASGLRDAAGQNRVREETLLGQFYRCLEKTTRQLVKLPPIPETLEEAVDKATKIDDHTYNVAQGMRNIGQAWAVSTNPGVVRTDGTTGLMTVVPGIEGDAGMPAATPTAEGGPEMEGFAYFTNPQAVFNKITGFWAVPRHQAWNGRYWAPTKKERAKPTATQEQRPAERRHFGKSDRKAKVMLAVPSNGSSSSEESDASLTPPKAKKRRAVIRQTQAVTSSTSTETGYHAAAKARNDEYLAQRKKVPKAAENEERAR